MTGQKKQRYLQHSNGRPRWEEVEVDGVKIPAITMVDGLCIFYSINLKVPRTLKTLKKQTEYLHKHLNQLSTWIRLLEGNPSYIPSALTVSWKSDRQRHRQRIKKISFGASLIGSTNTKNALLSLRQEFDTMKDQNQRMLPRFANGDLLM